MVKIKEREEGSQGSEQRPCEELEARQSRKCGQAVTEAGETAGW